MSFSKTSLIDTYKDCNILLTGCTGFLGKTLLSMLLSKLPQIKTIYLLIRSSKKACALDRFKSEVIASPALDPIKELYPDDYLDYVMSRIKIIEGDVALPNLGISDALLKELYKTIDLVMNVAGLVTFFPNTQDALRVNVEGALNAAEFVKNASKASLVHTSTCYVSGRKDGVFEESISADIAPNGLPFNAEDEYQFICKETQALLDSAVANKIARVKLVNIGQERAHYWGWNNTYCYTKALAEQLLVSRYPDINLTIVRPSIVESAERFPFPGWNVGLNTSAPITYLVLAGGYPFVIADKNNILDLVPVDYVCNCIIVIGYALLTKQAQLVYQLASSTANPLSFTVMARLTNQWNRTHAKTHKKTGWYHRITQLMPVRCIPPGHFLGPEKLLLKLKWLERITSYLRINGTVRSTRKKIQQINKVYNVFRAFTYDHQYRFTSKAINLIQPSEPEFQYQLKNLDWDNYWINIHLPGMKKWIFPLYEKKFS